jgi:hypothetical protein
MQLLALSSVEILDQFKLPARRPYFSRKQVARGVEIAQATFLWNSQAFVENAL